MADKSRLVMIDTSAWIDAFRERTPWIARVIRRLPEEDRAATCGPVIFELQRGLRPNERKKVLSLFEALHRLPFDESDWLEAGELDASLRAKGITLPSVDLLIARLCISNKLTLLTMDKHFNNVIPVMSVDE